MYYFLAERELNGPVTFRQSEKMHFPVFFLLASNAPLHQKLSLESANAQSDFDSSLINNVSNQVIKAVLNLFV